MTAAAGVATTAQPPNTVVNIQPGMNVQAVTLVDQNGQYVSMSGRYLCTPTSYAPATVVNLSTTSATLAALNVAPTTVAAGSNGGEISQIASWAAPSAGVLDVATTTNWPGSGTVTVATSTTTATVTYNAITAGQLTACAYVSGSATGTVSTGGAVTLTSVSVSTGSFIAPASGSVVVTAYGIYNGSSNDNVSFAIAPHGTVTPQAGSYVTTGLSNSSAVSVPPAIPFLVTGLTAGTSYNFDLLFAIAGGGTLSFRAFGQSGTTPTGNLGAPVVMTVQAV